MKLLFLYITLLFIHLPFSASAGDDPITWINLCDTVDAPRQTLKWGIKAGSQIKYVQIIVNGQIMKGINSVSNDGYDMVQSRVVNLQPQKNEVKIRVETAERTFVSTKTIYYLSKEEEEEDDDVVIDDEEEMEDDMNELLEAAYDHDPKAQYTLGLYYLNGSHGLERDLFESSLWFKKSAEQGYPDSQYEFAVALLEARGILRNKSLAVSWLMKAAEKKHAKAQYRLGLCYETGVGVKQNLEKAKELYRSCPLQEAKKRLSALNN